jgi:hypothetical protein
MTRRFTEREPEISGPAQIFENQRGQNDETGACDIAALIAFFRLLDKWDREVQHNAEVM